MTVPLHLPLQHHLREQWEIQSISSAAAGTFPIPVLYHRSLFFFFFFKLGGGTLTNTQPKALTLNKVNVDLSVCLQDGMEPKIFCAADGRGRLPLSYRLKFKNTTAGKCKQRKRSIYSSRGCWFFSRDDAVAAVQFIFLINGQTVRASR